MTIVIDATTDPELDALLDREDLKDGELEHALFVRSLKAIIRRDRMPTRGISGLRESSRQFLRAGFVRVSVDGALSPELRDVGCRGVAVVDAVGGLGLADASDALGHAIARARKAEKTRGDRRTKA
jgi:hypothetical protein